MSDPFRKYAQHLADCSALAGDGPFAPYPCSCGLDDLIDPQAAIEARRAHREAVALWRNPGVSITVHHS